MPELRFPEFRGEWEEKKLKDVVKFHRGTSLSKADLSNEGHPCILYGELYTTYQEVIKVVVSRTDTNKKLFLSKINDVIIPSSGETAEDISCASALLVKDVALGGDLNILRPNDKIINGTYLSYILNSVKKVEIAKIAQGASVVHVYSSGLGKLDISVTTLEEQIKIAKLFTLIDNKIEKQEEKVINLEEYKNGMMQKIFSQEIRFKDEDGEDYPEWEEKKLGEVSKVNQGLQISIKDRFVSKKDDSYFYITNEFLKKGSKTVYYIKNPPKAVICNKEDILMTRTGNTGMVVTNVHGAFHNNFFKIDYDKNILIKEYLVILLKSNEMQNRILVAAGQSTIPDLNHSEFYKLSIQIPNKQEQYKIANFLSSIDLKIEREKEKLDYLKELKKGLMQKMFI